MKNLTWQNPEQLFVAQVLINKVKSKCCGIKVVLQRCYNYVVNMVFEPSYKNWLIRLHNVCANKKNIMIMCDFSQKIFGDIN